MRIHPLIAVSRDELAELAGGSPLAISELTGGLTNTLHHVQLAADDLVVKHFGSLDGYRCELATLRALAGRLPVPELVRWDDRRRAIVYRFIAGLMLNDCRRHEPPAAFSSLAGPLGRLLAWLARVDAGDVLGSDDGWRLAAQLARATRLLVGSRARERMGNPLATALLAVFDRFAEALAWGTPCLCHHDIGGRNLLVQPAHGLRWRIAGVIDWESAGYGSPLTDIGGLFRFAGRYDAAFRDDFAAGYREAGGELPTDWFVMARLLDATRIIDTLDEPRELPGVYADCRMLLTQLVHELAATT